MAPVVNGGGPPAHLVVVGAHLGGEPLNHQLTDRGGELVGPVATAPVYRLFALDTVPPKPGLVRVRTGGASIQGERWRLDLSAFGSFVTTIPAPLAIGTITLADGAGVQGFLCESYATVGAVDVTSFGDWRAYRRSIAP